MSTRIECSKCGDMIEVTVTSVILPFLCLKCLKCEEITKNAKIRECTQATEDESVLESGDNSADEMLADMQIQLEEAQADVRILKEVQGLDEALIQDLKKQIELYKQRDHHHYYLVDEANNKIADLETSRNNLRRRGDLYLEWYREILQKYTAERERTWWSRLCN